MLKPRPKRSFKADHTELAERLECLTFHKAPAKVWLGRHAGDRRNISSQDQRQPQPALSEGGNGPPLVLLHTIRTQLEYFRELVPKLTSSRFTRPGHGHSPIDMSAAFDEPYFRGAIVAFSKKLDLKM